MLSHSLIETKNKRIIFGSLLAYVYLCPQKQMLNDNKPASRWSDKIYNPPVIGNAEGDYSFLDVKEANAPIGLWPDLKYVGEEMELPSGSMMLLYTDGLNEAENREQEQYGEDRIIELTTTHAAQSMRDFIEALKASTDAFRDGAEQNDDLTMLAIRVK